MLWLLLLVPVVAVWLLLRAKPALRHPTAIRTLGRFPRRHWFARHGPVVMRLLALTAMVLALAGPRWPDLKTRIRTEGIAIMLLVDISSSMGTPDFDWKGQPTTRLGATKKVFRLFVEGGEADGQRFEGRPTDLIGMITFGTRFETVYPLTLSHSVLLRQMDREKPLRDPSRSWTNLSDAILMGIHRMQKSAPERRVLVLLTDGIHNVDPPPSTLRPRQSAQIAASLDIPIYVLDVGNISANELSGEGIPSDSVTQAAERRTEAVRVMQQVANISRGRYFRADDTKTLLQVCKTIDQMEKTEVPSFQYRRYHEAYPWLGASAFVLIALAFGLEMTYWRKLP